MEGGSLSEVIEDESWFTDLTAESWQAIANIMDGNRGAPKAGLAMGNEVE